MHFSLEQVIPLLPLALFSSIVIAADVNAGFDVFTAAQVMANKASHSWEWGTAAEALLELYNNELSVFGPTPFPNGKIPPADPETLALVYAKPFINRNSQVLVDNSAVGDPASLGVSAILLGQSDSTYIGAANRQADYILNQAPRWSNGAISHRPDVAELWADNMAMSFPFLAYLAVQQNNSTLMAETVRQCGLQRDVLKTSQFLNWQHIIGPQSQDTGLWSTGNGWASYGMVRVLHTLQKWSGSSSMTSEANQLKSWIKEILDGAMLSGFDSGLLHNYLNDGGWFGEISGTALLTAVAYRMAVNDPSMFPQKYIDWADINRASLSQKEGASGVFSPAVDPYNWKDTNKFTTGSPEGQAFIVNLYTAFRDCVNAEVCKSSSPTATTISHSGIGPIDILTVLDHAITFSSIPPQPTCGPPQSCDSDGCTGSFNGLTKFPHCTAGNLAGCECTATANTCGPHQSCDLNGCAGSFNGLAKFAQCTGNFEGCECKATANTCGPHQSCDLNGCAGSFNGLEKFPQCTGNFVGCECTATANTCGPHQSCDLNGCAGAFNGLTVFPQCTGNFEGCSCTATANTCGPHQSCDLNGCDGGFNGLTIFAQCRGNFVGCECTATSKTCGPHQSCDLNGCAGSFDLSNGQAFCTGNFQGCGCSATTKTCGSPQSCDMNNCDGGYRGSVPWPQCNNFFDGCQCTATSNTCGPPQSCGMNGCAGSFDLSNGKAFCSENFYGCECAATPATCGAPQSCDKNNCKGKFSGSVAVPTCSDFFKGCVCTPTSNTCGPQQSCDLNGCAGGFDSNGVARCQGNFQGCPCKSSSNTCGTPQHCDLNGCAGSFDSSSNTARCRGNFAGCVCIPVASTCGTPQNCDLNGCNGQLQSDGSAVCTGNFFGCPCRPLPIWIPPPPSHLPPPPPTPSPTPQPPSLPPLQTPWYCLGVVDDWDCGFAGCTHRWELAARNMNAGTQESTGLTGIGHAAQDLCGATIGGAQVICQGDITQQCSGYGVALYNSRTCRTHCGSSGDPNFCFNINDGIFGTSLGSVLICDRALA